MRKFDLLITLNSQNISVNNESASALALLAQNAQRSPPEDYKSSHNAGSPTKQGYE